MAFSFEKIFDSDMAGKGNVGQPDTPGVSADEMKRIMDELVREVVVPKFNKLVDALIDAFSEVTSSVKTVSDKYDTVSKTAEAAKRTAEQAKTEADAAAGKANAASGKADAVDAKYTALEARVQALEGTSK